jgi:putative hydrolase of the HAD superfamily
MIRQPTAILLDLDDTILDDTGCVTRCWSEACAAHEARLGGLTAATLQEIIERTSRWFWADPERHRTGRLNLGMARREVVRLALVEAGCNVEAAAPIAERYSRLRDAYIKPFADAIDTVQWLQVRGYRLALLTNGATDAQQGKIERFSLGRLFDTILIEGTLGFGKPDPRVFERALAELRVNPEEAWMAGDNLEWDVREPQRLGLSTVWIDVRGGGLPAHTDIRPHHIVRRLSEIRSLLYPES